MVHLVLDHRFVEEDVVQWAEAGALEGWHERDHRDPNNPLARHEHGWDPGFTDSL